MAISKSNNNEEQILLNVQTETSEATKNIQELEKQLDKLQSVDIGVTGDAIDSVNADVEELNKNIQNTNKNKLTPQTDNSNLDNTILSIEEMEGLLSKLREDQKKEKDPLKLAQISKEANKLERYIDELSTGFRDVNGEISKLEDQMYALASAGKQGSEEFNTLLTEVSQLKQSVNDVNLAVDSLSGDNFSKFIGLGETMTSSFQGVVGTMQLMGLESTTAEQAMAKLFAIQSISQGLASVNEMRKRWIALMASYKQGKVITDTLNSVSTSTNAASKATQTLTATTEANTKATKVATIAQGTLNTVMKAAPWIAITSALIWLVANFDKFIATLKNLMPWITFLIDGFIKLKDSVTDFLGITSDATRALDKLKLVNEALVDGMGRQIEILSAMGSKEKEIYDLSVKRIQTKRKELELTASVHGKLTDEEKEQLIDLNQQQAVLYFNEKNRLNDLAKQREDKLKQAGLQAQQAYKQQLDTLKSYLKQAENVTFASNNNQRKTELRAIVDKYKEQLDLARKLGIGVQQLEESQRIERDIINKKYDDIYFQYITTNNRKFLDEFSREYMETIQSYTLQKKNATEEQKVDLDNRLNNQLTYLSKLKQLSISTAEAERDLNTALIATEFVERDTFKIKKQKLDQELALQKEHDETILYNTIQAKEYENEELQRIYIEGQDRLNELMANPEINAFDISILNAELDARLASIQQNQTDIENITLTHNQKIQKMEKANSTAKKKIDQETNIARTQQLHMYGDALADVGSIMSEHTALSKTLAISATAINSYASIAGQLKAFAGVPIPGYAIAQAVATGAVGLAQIAKIASVQVPNDNSSNGGSTRGVNLQAPVINSTILRTAENGNDQLNNTMSQTNEAIQNGNMRAYIVNQDLVTQDQKNRFNNSVRSY